MFKENLLNTGVEFGADTTTKDDILTRLTKGKKENRNYLNEGKMKPIYSKNGNLSYAIVGKGMNSS